MDEYYIPGFTDYLSSSVSPTAMAAGQPGATSPQTLQAMLAQLDQLKRGRYAKPIAGETASGLTTMDGLSGLQFITNKGKAASVKANRSGFVPYVEGAEYRLTNERKKQYGIAASGVGEEGLKSVYNTARNLSATQGKKADWVVEMKDPASGQWVKVADDDPKTSPLSVVGKVVGTALPIAVSLIPGLQFAGPVLSSALAGGAGAALAGRDPLKGAVMGGLSAAGGQVIGGALQSGGALGTNLAANAARAVGTGVGSFAGGLATGQSLQNAALGGLAAGGLSYLGGEIFKPGASPTGEPINLLEGTPYAGNLGAGAPNVAAGGGGSAGGGLPSETPGDLAAAFDKAFAVAPNAGTANIASAGGGGGSAGGGLPSDIVVTGANQAAGISSPNIGVGTPTLPTSSPAQQQQQQQEPPASDDPNEIVVSAVKSAMPDFSAIFGTAGTEIAKFAEEATKNLTEEQKKGLTTADYIRLASLAIGLGGDLFGGGGGGSGARVPSGLGGGANLGSVFTNPLPAPNMPGLTAGTGGPRAPTDLAAGGLRSPQDYYRYGYGPEQSFFQQIPQGAPNTSTAFTGYAEGGSVSDEERIAKAEIEREREYEGERRHRRRPQFSTQHSFDGDDAFSSYSLAVPVGERGDVFIDAMGRGLLPDDYMISGQYRLGDLGVRASRMLGGGSDYGISLPVLGGDLDVSASAPRGFRPRGVRASFSKRFEEGGYAVGGKGDGRDDKIPALLSDGEYVIDAETVAMLGNGSNKAGAKRLDDLRVNIRKHKGRKLASGKFSDNAKKPEQYLAKGRKHG